MKTSKKVIIRFALVAEQPNLRDEEKLSSMGNENSIAGIKRYTGFVRGKDLFGLFDNVSLEANPRSAKRGAVVRDIIDSLNKTPELFPFKSKGILLGTSTYEPLQRNRFALHFNDPASEGILDGGHNMLAIGIHMLSLIIGDPGVSKISRWDEMKELWDEHRDDLEQITDQFEFLVPVELIVPSDVEDQHAVMKFEMAVLDICAARNNNAQLTQETKSNKKGYYDAIRERLDEKLAARIEWKSNEWESDDVRPIKVRDLLALAWIPLNKANEKGLLPTSISVSPQNIYRNKGECSKQFESLMEKACEAVDGPTYELRDKVVESAFDILAKLPALYDKIYEEFPEAYNSNKYRFGANPIVKIYDPERRMAASDKSGFVLTQPTTLFYGRDVKYRYPDGLIMPLVYGLQGLMTIKHKKVVWATDPVEFLDLYLSNIAGAYRLVLDMAKFDPQKLAKNEASHDFAVSEFKKALVMHEAKTKAA